MLDAERPARTRQTRTVVIRVVYPIPGNLGGYWPGKPEDASRRYGMPIETPEEFIAERLRRIGDPPPIDDPERASIVRHGLRDAPRAAVTCWTIEGIALSPTIVQVVECGRDYRPDYDYGRYHPGPELTIGELQVLPVLGFVRFAQYHAYPDGETAIVWFGRPIDLGRKITPEGAKLLGGSAAWSVPGPIPLPSAEAAYLVRDEPERGWFVGVYQIDPLRPVR